MELDEKTLEEYLEFAKDIANHAEKIMLKYFSGNNKGETYKVDKTIVTLADKEINSYLIERVKEKYPNHSVDGEEESFGESKYKWICDPVDGTAMYAREIPVAVFSLALVVDGESVLGVVYDPFTKSMYSAIKGKGTYLNDNKITVNDYNLDDKECVCNFDMWSNAEYNIFDVIKKLGEKTYFVSIGSVIRGSMCVASGKFAVALFPGTVRKYCDIAAVKVIVEEAGGIVKNFYGEEQRYDEDIKGAIVSNKVVYEEVKNVLKEYCLDKKYCKHV